MWHRRPVPRDRFLPASRILSNTSLRVSHSLAVGRIPRRLSEESECGRLVGQVRGDVVRELLGRREEVLGRATEDLGDPGDGVRRRRGESTVLQFADVRKIESDVLRQSPLAEPGGATLRPEGRPKLSHDVDKILNVPRRINGAAAEVPELYLANENGLQAVQMPAWIKLTSSFEVQGGRLLVGADSGGSSEPPGAP